VGAVSDEKKGVHYIPNDIVRGHSTTASEAVGSVAIKGLTANCSTEGVDQKFAVLGCFQRILGI
jgi:hypothetical protein